MNAEMKSEQMPVGCFAPPLTDEKLERYEELIAGCADAEVKDAMSTCMSCVMTWWDLPESTRKDGQGLVVLHRTDPKEDRKPIVVPMIPLEEVHIKKLDKVTPFMRELIDIDLMVFEKLPAGELRNAAYHLLWYAKELTLDREPMTMDKL